MQSRPLNGTGTGWTRAEDHTRRNPRPTGPRAVVEDSGLAGGRPADAGAMTIRATHASRANRAGSFLVSLEAAEKRGTQGLRSPAGQKLDVLRQLLYAEKGQRPNLHPHQGVAPSASRKNGPGRLHCDMIPRATARSRSATGALSGFQEGRSRCWSRPTSRPRGLHCDDVAHVINYDLPKMAEDFIHRVGVPDAAD